MRQIFLALAFLLAGSEARAQWPLSVSLAGTSPPPRLWVATGSVCHPALVIGRRGAFFNQSTCSVTYQPQERIGICCLLPGNRRTAQFLEAATDKNAALVPSSRTTIAQAAPK